MRLKKARGSKWKGFDRLEAKASATMRSLFKITFIEVVPRFSSNNIAYFGDEIRFRKQLITNKKQNKGV